jgi:PTS system ascorbate-specific IIA component
MIGVIEEFGAYVVIAPGLALAHARPGADVRREGLAVVTLAEAVPFGHPHNDPVRVVIGLAVSNAETTWHRWRSSRTRSTTRASSAGSRAPRPPTEVRGLLGVDAAPAGTDAGA